MLVTTLTKKMAEDLTDYLLEQGLRVRYLHSNIDTIERIEILRDLRLGEFDVLVGINLLREGLDLPEVSLVAILDADKEGFLRSETSLIQTIGRAARNVDGQVDHVRRHGHRLDAAGHRRDAAPARSCSSRTTPSTASTRRPSARRSPTSWPTCGRRRERPGAGRGSPPGTAGRGAAPAHELADLPPTELGRLIQTLEEEMHEAAADLRFEYAARLRDEVNELKRELREAGRLTGRAARPARVRREHVVRRHPGPALAWPAVADSLVIRGAREHNLRNVNLELPRDKLIVFTGLSGSGKSSLAFDTIYAEGQRRYVESLSAYARQFLGQMDKPDVDFIEGLSPAISIDQKSASRNPRSTVGTITEVYDYLRLLYARIGVPHCPECGARGHPPDPAADRRPHPRAARGHPVPGAGAGGAGPQGHLRDAAGRPGGPGLRPGPGRRRGRTSRPTRSSSPATSSTRSR